ncbi:MAG: hypothetical protein JWQ88_1624 [Rhodoferax sp.]|nr:hypothetical protein [Rhodoferax sp.]
MRLSFLTSVLHAWRSRLAMWATIAAMALGAISPAAHAAASRDYLTLLIPDNASLTSWQVQVWTDAAAEEGIQIRTLTDSAFLALGTTAVGKIAGLVLPDSAHIQASDALVAAVKSYVSNGGKLLLTYDAGSLTSTGTYALSGKSRFSDMVGVDYVLYDTLRDQVVGFGPIVGNKGRMDNLSLPPGKYLPYVAPSIATAAAFVPSTTTDPGGSTFMRPRIEARARGWDARRLAYAESTMTPLRYAASVSTATQALTQLTSQLWGGTTTLRNIADVSAVATTGGADWYETLASATASKLAASDAVMQAVSGYGFGELGYYHYVTTGTFPGNVYLTSPQHGLVAGERSYGTGKLVFVNIPLGYFKAIGTDGALLHGFLNQFARDHVAMPRMSAQPKGVGGLVYNWHVDDGDDLLPDFKYLMTLDFMQNQGPFSVHFTAGPDVSVAGDGQGMNLPNNPAAKDVVLKTGKFGPYANSWGKKHTLGSHGGWNHDLYGINASEDNAATYLPWVLLNFSAIENVIGEPLREYSAPQGNNPLWATRWIESHGVVGMYTTSDGGSAATREWRAGQRTADKLWTTPIAPFGKNATFEEFEENGVSDATAAQWLIDLQSFVVNNRTNRLFYNHPPGARAHLGVVKTFVRRAASLQAMGRFNWYTMAQLGDFSQRRIQTTWSSTSSWGQSRFNASNPVSLTDMTWLIPRSRYYMPVVVGGYGTVNVFDTKNWIVTAQGGTSLSFVAGDR